MSLLSKVECGRDVNTKETFNLNEGKNKPFLMVTKDFRENRLKKMQQKGYLVLTKE